MSNPVTQCVEALKAHINAVVTDYGDKLFEVYDQDILLDTAKDLIMPCAGVVYEGLTSSGGAHRTGLACELYVGIIVLAGSKESELRGQEEKSQITSLLDRTRNSIKHEIAPTGHKWEFVLETPMDIHRSSLGYYQKWKTKAILM